MHHFFVIWAVDQLHCGLQTGVELANVKMSMNPFCEIAVEVHVICCHKCVFVTTVSKHCNFAGSSETEGTEDCQGGSGRYGRAQEQPGMVDQWPG